jgi:hypothetical protein
MSPNQFQLLLSADDDLRDAVDARPVYVERGRVMAFGHCLRMPEAVDGFYNYHAWLMFRTTDLWTLAPTSADAY